jgi:hypothetical protein
MFSFAVVFLFAVAIVLRLLYVLLAYVKNRLDADVFLRIRLFLSACVMGYEERGIKKVRMAKSKKNKNKPKLNLTVREEQRNKLEQMASLENRSVSNLIEVMADERWERLTSIGGGVDAGDALAQGEDLVTA